TTARPTRARRRGCLPRCRDDGRLAHVFAAPGFEGRAVAPRLRPAILRLRRRDPRPDRPALPVNEPLVLQQVGAWMILRPWRWHALELLPLDVVTLLAQLGHDAGDLFA